MRNIKNILITGGCGFIGSNFIKFLINQKDFQGKIINLDKLTYAGNIENLKDIANNTRYIFIKGDIGNKKIVNKIFIQYSPDIIINFAAETHVDKSISKPSIFLKTNILGVYNLIQHAKKFWGTNKQKLFYQISTDEVYGSIEKGSFTEESPYQPNNPYSAAKASADHLVMSYFQTYKLPIIISNCSNNYGPYQNREKLIPKIINNILENKKLPTYGDGKNVRDWIFVLDHCKAIWEISKHGKIGEKYNIGGETEIKNIDLVNIICEIIAKKYKKQKNYYKNLITFVKDRKGHDKRYSINCEKLKKEFGWEKKYNFNKGIDYTIQWYLQQKK